MALQTSGKIKLEESRPRSKWILTLSDGLRNKLGVMNNLYEWPYK